MISISSPLYSMLENSSVAKLEITLERNELFLRNEIQRVRSRFPFLFQLHHFISHANSKKGFRIDLRQPGRLDDTFQAILRLRAQNSFPFLVTSQALSFLVTHLFLLSLYTAPFYPLSFLSFISFLSFPFPSVFLFLFPIFLPGKLEHFSYLPGSTTTMLRHFLSPVVPVLKDLFLSLLNLPRDHRSLKTAKKYKGCFSQPRFGNLPKFLPTFI